MVMRWDPAALLAAEKGFYRIRGADNLGKLIHTLEQHQDELATMQETGSPEDPFPSRESPGCAILT